MTSTHPDFTGNPQSNVTGASLSFIEDHKPHVTVVGISDNCHVIPVSVFQKLVTGELKPSDVCDFDDILPSIIEEWMRYLDID